MKSILMKNGHIFTAACKIYAGGNFIKNALHLLKPIIVKKTHTFVNIEGEVQGVYLIGTQKGLYILKNNNLSKLLDGRFYGITISSKKIYVFEKTGTSNGRIIELEINNNFEINKRGKVLINKLSPGCHQIDIVDDKLFIMDTYNNCILAYNLSDFSYNAYYPLGKLDNGRKSNNYAHMNSLYHTENRFFVMCHNETSKTGRQSEILVLDSNLRKIEKIDTKASHAHNIVVLNNQFIYCDSTNNCLKVDNEIVFKGKHFTRGLSISKEHVLLGGSDHAKRADRTKVNGYIYVLNHDFSLFTQFLVPGMVQEIRRLDKPDISLSNYAND
ncbi:MAG: hypothetical protein R2741_08120 [Methanolobus sp.]